MLIIDSFVIVEFSIYLHYVRKLKFDEDPDYAFCESLFDKALKRLDAQDDEVYDWMLINDGKGWEVRTILSIQCHQKSQLTLLPELGFRAKEKGAIDANVLRNTTCNITSYTIFTIPSLLILLRSV